MFKMIIAPSAFSPRIASRLPEGDGEVLIGEEQYPAGPIIGREGGFLLILTGYPEVDEEGNETYTSWAAWAQEFPGEIELPDEN
jgi:hypothetical protein